MALKVMMLGVSPDPTIIDKTCSKRPFSGLLGGATSPRNAVGRLGPGAPHLLALRDGGAGVGYVPAGTRPGEDVTQPCHGPNQTKQNRPGASRRQFRAEALGARVGATLPPRRAR